MTFSTSKEFDAAAARGAGVLAEKFTPMSGSFIIVTLVLILAYRMAVSAVYGQDRRKEKVGCCSLFGCTWLICCCWPCALRKLAKKHLKDEEEYQVPCVGNHKKTQIDDVLCCCPLFFIGLTSPCMAIYSFYVMAYAAREKNISFGEMTSCSNIGALVCCTPCFVEGLAQKLDAAVGEPVEVKAELGARLSPA